MSSQKGFTLLELLIVIAIIGVLSAVAIMAMDDSKRKSRNSAVISQMYEYQKSLELYFTDAGTYPRTNLARTHKYCVGEGQTAGQRCMGNVTTGYSPAATAPIESAFLTRMTRLPRIKQSRGGYDYSSPAYSGCVGSGTANTTCGGGQYSIWFLMEGTNESCGRAIVADANLVGEFTLCRLMAEIQ